MTRLAILPAAALLLAVLAVPAEAQQYKMRVDPAKVEAAKDSSVTLKITYDIGKGWKDAPNDQWYSLVQPADLGKVTIRGGRLVFDAKKIGTGKLHLWHKSQMSWLGLYVVLPLTVTKAAPKRDPEHEHEHGTGRLRSFLVQRMDRLIPQLLDPRGTILVNRGEKIPMAIFGLSERGQRVPVQPSVHDASRSCRVLEPKGHRFSLHFPDDLHPGKEITVSISDKLSGAKQKFKFQVRTTRVVVSHMVAWFKIGLKGEWELLGNDGELRLRPGQIVFFTFAGFTKDGRGAPFKPKLELERGGGSKLNKIAPQMWSLVTGFDGRKGRKSRIHVTVPNSDAHLDIDFRLPE